ncbi:recombinase [Thermovenabulum sp.]|uniref:recombinase n=1 Tax=Thermovenabulum sp. TaxID=3100335 RepID=UPI003C7AC43A
MRVELKGKVGEMMSHIPFGYIIQNGRADVNEEEAVKIEKLFEAYLSGLSLTDAAQKAGIKRYHTSIARMLADKRYVEDKFYPPIISRDTFEKAQLERRRRAEALGRIYEHKGNEKKILNFRFHASMPDNLYDDPFQQAEYAYSLIKSEVILDDNEECYSNSCP